MTNNGKPVLKDKSSHFREGTEKGNGEKKMGKKKKYIITLPLA